MFRNIDILFFTQIVMVNLKLSWKDYDKLLYISYIMKLLDPAKSNAKFASQQISASDLQDLFQNLLTRAPQTPVFLNKMVGWF